MFAVFEIMAFEHFPEISPTYHENTCDRHSKSYQTVLRFQD